MQALLSIAQAQAWAIYGTEDAVHECRKPSYRFLHVPPGPLILGSEPGGGRAQRSLRQPLPNWEDRHKKLRDALESATIQARSVDAKGQEYDVPASAWARYGIRMGGSGGALIPSDQLIRVLPKTPGGSAAFKHDRSRFRPWFEEIIASNPAISENQVAQDLQERCDHVYGKASPDKEGKVKSQVAVSTFKRMIKETWSKGPFTEATEKWFTE